MLKLEAYAPVDGWAIVKEGDSLRLLKPPYKSSDLTPVSPEVLEEAIGRHGFEVSEKEFDGWRSLTGFLKDEFVRTREEMGRALDPEKIRDLIRFAPPDVISKYLDKIGKELLPNHEWKPAKAFLERLLTLDQVKGSNALFQRASDLLEDCKVDEAQYKEHRRSLVDQEAEIKLKFPLATRRFGSLPMLQKRNQVARNGQLLSPGR